MACINNNQLQLTLTHDLVTEQKREKEEKKKYGGKKHVTAMKMAEETGVEED